MCFCNEHWQRVRSKRNQKGNKARILLILLRLTFETRLVDYPSRSWTYLRYPLATVIYQVTDLSKGKKSPKGLITSSLILHRRSLPAKIAARPSLSQQTFQISHKATRMSVKCLWICSRTLKRYIEADQLMQKTTKTSIRIKSNPSHPHKIHRHFAQCHA